MKQRNVEKQWDIALKQIFHGTARIDKHTPDCYHSSVRVDYSIT
jgi:hypothetical protein